MDAGRPPATSTDLTVADVMSTPLITVEAEATLSAARDLLERHRFHHLLVTDRGVAVAIVSDRDILRAMSPFVGTIAEQPRDSRVLLRPIYQIASYRPITVEPTASVYEAAAILLEHGISCLPVRHAGGAFVGIVTSNDLMRGMVSCRLPVAGGTLADVA